MSNTTSLGFAFLLLGLAAMFLMYRLWGYPFDKTTRTSAAPRWAMLLHRVFGYAFALIYFALMWRMVPRLWEYQVEFPARTTAHIVLAFTIGFLLIVKISIIRWFRHFEEWMPYLGTAIMLCTVILLGLSLPFALQERALARAARGGDVLSAESRARVAQLLPSAGLPPAAPVADLSSVRSLREGRNVLLDNCVRCHDLRTILAKPRTPSGWWSTVERMADKPALFRALTEREMYVVTAYLIAITPDLQRASRQRREHDVARAEAVELVSSASHDGEQPAAVKPAIDLPAAKTTYEAVCSQCHELAEIEKAPPKTSADVRAVIQRMIEENEAELSTDQITSITAWMEAQFVGHAR